MNSSEVKKIVWGVNLIVIAGLAFIGYIVQKKISKPNLVITAYNYKEPIIKKDRGGNNGINRHNVNAIFGWRPPVKIKKKTVKVATKKHVRRIAVVKGISQVLELHHIIGDLAFIYIKKDKKTRTYIANNEIKDASKFSIGILKEVHAHYVLIQVNKKMEKLYIDGYVAPKKTQSSNTKTNPSKKSTTNKTATINKTKSKKTTAIIKKRKTHKEVVINNRKSKNSELASGSKSPIGNNDQNDEQPDVVIKRQSSFNGNPFEFSISKDKDGTTHRRIPMQMARTLQSRENKEIFLNTGNYNLTYLKTGILVKSIKNPEVKKFFNAFGIQKEDVITKVNGQTLGNKSEDDILELYQQIEGSAKYVTIELLKKGTKLQKFRVSIDTIKKNTRK